MPIKCCSEAYFSGLRFFNEPQARDPQLKVPPQDLCLGFFRPEKIHRHQPGLNLLILVLEASTVPRDHREKG